LLRFKDSNSKLYLLLWLGQPIYFTANKWL